MRRTLIDVAPEVYVQIGRQQEYFRAKEPGEPGEALAKRFEEAVFSQISSLRTYPERGAFFRFRRHRREALRWLSIAGFRRHLLFYHYNLTERRVHVVNLRHSSMDIEAVLRED
jgi:plasmid stabilization system protein ParE